MLGEQEKEISSCQCQLKSGVSERRVLRSQVGTLVILPNDVEVLSPKDEAEGILVHLRRRLRSE